jgi:hypothetical protein
MKGLQTICSPMMTKLHGGANSNNNKNSQNSTGGPTNLSPESPTACFTLNI